MNIYNKLDHLSIKLLQQLGNHKPTSEQIKLLESLLIKVDINHKLYFNDCLTRQEINCLLLAAKGKTVKQAARILNIEISTIQTYHKRIKEKLLCATIAQAVFVGIQYGYLPPRGCTKICP